MAKKKSKKANGLYQGLLLLLGGASVLLLGLAFDLYSCFDALKNFDLISLYPYGAFGTKLFYIMELVIFVFACLMVLIGLGYIFKIVKNSKIATVMHVVVTIIITVIVCTALFTVYAKATLVTPKVTLYSSTENAWSLWAMLGASVVLTVLSIFEKRITK